MKYKWYIYVFSKYAKLLLWHTISFSTFFIEETAYKWRVDGIVLVLIHLIVLEYQYSHVGKEESCSLATGKVNIPKAVLLRYQDAIC